MFEITLNGGSYEVRKEDELVFSHEDIYEVMFSLQQNIHRESLKHVTDRVRIHGGCGEYEGNRFIVVGDKGVGKTTLMVRLLFSGFRIIGDEILLVKDGKALPFSRRFHIKQESMQLLPELDGLIEKLPYNETSYGHKMYSFSPHDAGYEWKVDDGGVDFIFYLEPNHGGKSRLELCPKIDMVQRLMPMSFISEKEDHKKIAELCRVVDQAECYILHNGDLDGAATAMQEKMSVL